MLGNLLGGMWKWITAAAVFAAGILYLLLKAARAEKAAEKVKAKREKAKRRASDASREKGRDISKAQGEAREEAEEHDREKQKRRDGGDPPDGDFGDRL